VNTVVHESVCALISAPRASLRRAVADQSRPLDRIVAHSSSLADGLRLALGTGSEWIWVLDGSAEPVPTALSALLDGLRRVDGLERPAVLAGVPMGGDGRVDARFAPWYRRQPTEDAMEASAVRLLPIRAATGPVLVRSSVAREMPPGRWPKAAPDAVLAWTARILRYRAGYLVPDSASVMSGDARDPLRNPATAAGLVAGRAFGGMDRARVAVEAGERLVARLTGPAPGAPRAGPGRAYERSPD
jgi:hypothetical protein